MFEPFKMGNLDQAIEKDRLSIRNKLPLPEKISKISASLLAEKIFAQAEAEDRPFDGIDKHDWIENTLKSKRFYLTQLPTSKIASPVKKMSNPTLVYRLKAEAQRHVPIVVDINKNKLGKTSSGFYPKVIVVDGHERFEAVTLLGDPRILAWVGAEAAEYLDIHADDKMSSNELRDALSSELNDSLGLNTQLGFPNPSYAYIEEVYPFENYFIYNYQTSGKSQKYRQHYQIDQEARTVTFVGNPTEVKQMYVDKSTSDPLHSSGRSSLEQAMQMSSTTKCTGMKGCACKKCVAKRSVEAGGPGSGRHKIGDKVVIDIPGHPKDGQQGKIVKGYHQPKQEDTHTVQFKNKSAGIFHGNDLVNKSADIREKKLAMGLYVK